MKRVLFSAVILSCSLLAACGGGGSTGGNPIPQTTNPPPQTQYTAQLRFVGTLAGHTAMQSDLRRAQSVTLGSGTSTPIPIMIVAPIFNNCMPYDCAVEPGGQQGIVQAVVSPMPSIAPSISFSQNANGVSIIATPTPAPSTTPAPLPSGVIAETGIGNTAPNVQSAGTATATIGNPVNAQPATPVYQYLGIAAVCDYTVGPGASEVGPGWAWNGSAWKPVSDPTQADLYVTGKYCTGSYVDATDANGTLHFPGGGTLLSTDTPFSAIAASQWSNTEASVTSAALGVANADGSYNAILVAKTRDGQHIFKIFPTAFGDDNGGLNYVGGVEVAGAGVDGF